MERSSKPFEKRLEELTLDDRVFTILALTEPPADMTKDNYMQPKEAMTYDVTGSLYAKLGLLPKYSKDLFEASSKCTILTAKLALDSLGDFPKRLYSVLTSEEKMLLVLGKGTTQTAPGIKISEIDTDEFENTLLNYELRGIYFLRRYEGIELKETDRILRDAERLANDGKPREINNTLFENWKNDLRRYRNENARRKNK